MAGRVDAGLMRLPRLVSLALLLLSAPFARAEDAPPIHVTASRSLQLLVVDAYEADSPSRGELGRRMAEAIRSAVALRVAGEVRLKTENTVPRAAAERLHAGACDAVLVLGPSRPRALRRTEAPTLASTLGPERNEEPVYLVLAVGDPHLQQLLTDAFPVAISNSRVPRRAIAAR